MTSYFRNVPNIDYVNRNFESTSSLDQFITTKNLFKRVKLRDDIFGSLNFFDKYQIIGDERPDNVAYKVYGDEILDWIILLSNNILNIQSEWPLSQEAFDTYLFEKYGAGVENKDDVYNIIYNGIHHFESKKITNKKGAVVFQEGVRFTPPERVNLTDIDPGYPAFILRYFDSESQIIVQGEDLYTSVSNYEYEVQLEENKRNIFVLKPRYLNIIFNDIEKTMPYVEGSDQYVSAFLKRVDDIRLHS